MPFISDLPSIRAEGVLAPASATGAVQDNQLTGAQNLAFQRMMILFTLTEYDTVRLYAGVDAALVEKKNRFRHAESSYAIAELVNVLSSDQFVQNGFAKEKSVGQSKITLATPQDVRNAQAVWEQKAIDWLRPYLKSEILDDDGETKFFRSKDRKLTITAI
jgi:hypothetical protein